MSSSILGSWHRPTLRLGMFANVSREMWESSSSSSSSYSSSSQGEGQAQSEVLTFFWHHWSVVPVLLCDLHHPLPVPPSAQSRLSSGQVGAVIISAGFVLW